MIVEIVELTIHEWLCREHQAARIVDGWSLENVDRPADPRALCADCETERQWENAKGRP